MNGRKGSGLLLLLAIPFGLYAAWQVNGVARTDMVVSDAPADRGATKEQLAVAKNKATAWSAEVKKAVSVAWQYRPEGPDDATADATVDGVVKASAKRARELKDLDHFLSGVAGIPYTGELKNFYEQWKVEFADAERDAREVQKWLESPPSIASVAEAVEAMRKANGLIDQYSARSKFADRTKAVKWRVRARLIVLNALNKLADEQYRAAVGVKLPLKEGANEVKTAVRTLEELKKQIDSLTEAAKQAEEDKVTLDGSLRGQIDAQGAVADQCKASLELLKLFAKEDLMANPTGAAAWLKQVGEQYGNTKDEKVRTLIREKVQQFCEAFIPVAVRLDDVVYIRDQRVTRANVTISFIENGKRTDKPAPLSDDPDNKGLNEFNVADRYPDETTFVLDKGSQEFLKFLAPTQLSRAAVDYTRERKKLGDGAIGPKWTAKSVEELKKQCAAQKELVDQLKAPKSGPKDEKLKLWVRLGSLAEGLKAVPALIGEAP